MTFEEEFPSLVIKVRVEDPVVEGWGFWTIERFLESVQESCLDKERVRKAIEKIRLRSDEACNDWHYIVDNWMDELLEGLGLE